ncbi:hypothetical protein PROFUN_15141 [Planoprotostelium fungivorum]|uniref:Uncharacterized protein n=1 Tax=Planoprotostelium fungivorum TaxID=1890364 RepID=A0A2P6MXQ3_9EUKA|nr:hypothetical protein PROFUN_15141 [Planoprotostelium fungivorum]
MFWQLSCSTIPWKAVHRVMRYDKPQRLFRGYVYIAYHSSNHSEAATSNTNILRKKQVDQGHAHSTMSNPITEQEERTARDGKRYRPIKRYHWAKLRHPIEQRWQSLSLRHYHPHCSQEIPEMKKLVLCTTAQLKEYSRLHCNGKIGRSRAQIIGRLTGVSPKEAQVALDAVTITEKKGLTNTDGFGQMKMKRIQEDPDMKNMCQLWEAMRVAEGVRFTLHNRLTNGTQNYGHIFLGEMDVT